MELSFRPSAGLRRLRLEMTPEEFRRDPYLRASGYNLYLWGAVNLLVAVPALTASVGHRWGAAATTAWTAGAIVCGVLLSAMNDNRLRKMLPDVADAPAIPAGRIWGPLLTLGSVGTALAVFRGQVAYVQPLWMLVVGTAYWQWGSFTLGEFRRLGQLLVGAGAASAWAIGVCGMPGEEPSVVSGATWVVCMGILWFPLGLYLNRRYLRTGDPP